MPTGTSPVIVQEGRHEDDATNFVLQRRAQHVDRSGLSKPKRASALNLLPALSKSAHGATAIDVCWTLTA